MWLCRGRRRKRRQLRWHGRLQAGASGGGKRYGGVAELAAKAAAALKKKQDAHNKAINDWDAAFEERQRFLDAGIGDEFKDWERDLKRMREEQNKLDAMSDAFGAKGEDIKRQREKMITCAAPRGEDLPSLLVDPGFCSFDFWSSFGILSNQ